MPRAQRLPKRRMAGMALRRGRERGERREKREKSDVEDVTSIDGVFFSF